MSTFYCQECDSHHDSDFECAYEVGDELICEACYDKICEEQKAHWKPRYEGEKLAGMTREDS